MLLPLFTILLGVVKGQHTLTHHEFGYGNTTDEVYGPPDWHKLDDVDCGGDRQSPVNINTGTVAKKHYPDLKITFDNQRGLVTGELVNNGHSPTLNIEKSEETAEITGGPLGDTTYTLIQFHIHFGCENSRGSEHTLNGKPFAGELHLVFENSGHFAVVALWLKPSSRGNPILGKFAKLLPNIIKPDTSTEVDESDGIRLMGLLPINSKNGGNGGENGVNEDNERNGGNGGNGNNGNNGNGDDKKEVILTDYFHYEGSLTTPPCTETVKWLILKSKLRTSNYQLDQFRQLQAHHDRRMCDNYRPLQPLKGRKVYSVGNRN